MRLFFRKKKCPVCGKHRFTEKYEICPVCGWENDPVQARDKDFAGGANELSVNQARQAYIQKTEGKEQK